MLYITLHRIFEKKINNLNIFKKTSKFKYCACSQVEENRKLFIQLSRWSLQLLKQML